MSKKAKTQHDFFFTAFGVLQDLHWPRMSSKVGHAKVYRVDKCPAVVRRELNPDYLSRATRNADLAATGAREHRTRGKWSSYPVLETLGRSPLSLAVDPVVSRHLLVVQDSCVASKQSEADSRLWRKMADALAAIRLATESNVSLVAPTKIIRNKSHKMLGWGSQPELERRTAYPLVVADKTSVRTAARLGRTLKTAKNHVAVAIRRFNLSFGRQEPEDRLIDLVVGLEALYLPDGNAELKYRLQVRAAHHLGDSQSGRSIVFDEIDALYKMRSKIVHGSAPDIARAARKTVFAGRPREAMDQAVKLLARGCSRTLLVSTEAKDLGAYFDSLVLGTSPT